MVDTLLVGTNHRLEPFSRLQELVVQREAILAGILTMQQEGRTRGGVLLTTCNRVEILLEGVTDSRGVAAELLGNGVVTLELQGVDAVAHLLRVATGIHSMVLGEEQILGQLSRAFQEAESHGLLGRALHMLRTRILASARDIRQRTGLADTRVSVACVGARRLIQAGSRLAVVGVGEMGRHALEVLARLGSRDVLVVNRTFSKAAKLATHYGYRALSLAEFRRNPPPLDGVLLALTSPEPILKTEMVRGLQLAVDLSLPSVLATDLGEQRGLTILQLDDIGKIASTEAHERTAAADLAEKLILARAKQIHREIDSGRVDLGSVIDRHVTNAMDELELAFRGNLAHLSDEDQDSLRQVLNRLARRNAHFHIQDLKELVGP